MFWRFGGYANVSTIDSLLEKPDVTVEELLDDADLIQEVKAQNSKLLEFLRDENVLDRLMQYVVMPKPPDEEIKHEPEEPEDVEEEASSSNPLGSLFGKNKRRSRSKSIKEDNESKEEKQRMKHAYVSCEVLSSDVWSIAEALLENRESLRRFWQYLKREAPLDGLQAQYFCKVNESLLDKKTEDMLNFIKSLDGVVDDLLRHVDCAVMMDLLLKIVSLERVEGGAGIIDWLQGQNLIPQLLSNLSADHEPSIQTAAGDFLKAVITISANATAQDSNVIGPNELTRQLVSEECISMLIKEMIRGGNSLTVGVGIVIEVIRKNNSDYDIENQIGPVPKSSDPIYLGTLLRQFARHIPDFVSLIQSKNETRKELKVAFGQRIEPLGFDRFKTCELMAELLHCSNMILLNQPGAEREVKTRDADRARLKIEGKLTAFNEESSGHEFGTSVDSSGFHHARAPSLGSPAGEGKRLGVSNNTDEDFEDILPPTNLVEAKDEFEKEESEDSSSTPEANDPSSKTAEDVAAELTSQLDAMTMSEGSKEDHTIEGAGSPKEPSKTTPTDAISIHAEDKPAPLFFGKPRTNDTPNDTNDSSEQDSSTKINETHFEEDSEPDSALFQADENGEPVVGDLLKMKFVEHRVVPTVIEFLFRFPWNNFLHNVVYDVVQQVFNGQLEHGFNKSLAVDVFDNGKITEKIVQGQAASDEAQAKSNMRLGYMGHLTLIAEEVVKFTERLPPQSLSPTISEKTSHEDWIFYVTKTLTETRERDNAILGGVRPDAALGPRQAVLNAVSVAQGFGGISSLANLTNNASIDLENIAAAPEDTTNRSSYLFSGSSLMSGFSHGSSDEEEDNEGEEEDADQQQRSVSNFIDEADQEPGDTDPITGAPPIPQPLNPTRARGKFAARMAQRRMEQAAAQKAAAAAAGEGGDDEATSASKAATGERSRRSQRHGGDTEEEDEDEDDEEETEEEDEGESSPDDIEDVERLIDGDDEDDDDEEDEDDEEESSSRRVGAHVDDFLASDDSVEGEDIGIVMKKYERWSGPASAGDSSENASSEEDDADRDVRVD